MNILRANRDNLKLGCCKLRRVHIFEQESRYLKLLGPEFWRDATSEPTLWRTHASRTVVECELVRETTLSPKRDLYDA